VIVMWLPTCTASPCFLLSTSIVLPSVKKRPGESSLPWSVADPRLRCKRSAANAWNCRAGRKSLPRLNRVLIAARCRRFVAAAKTAH